MRARRTQALLTCMALMLIGPSVHAVSPSTTPRALITQASTRITTLAQRAQGQDALYVGVTEVLSEIVDFRAFSARTMRGSWRGLTEPQRVRFEAAFRGLVLSVYAKRLKVGMGISVSFRGATEMTDASHATVRTTLQGAKAGLDIDYQMHAIKVGGGLHWRVIDLVIDDVSMVRNWRRTFITVIERDGYEVLVKKIEKRARRR